MKGGRDLRTPTGEWVDAGPLEPGGQLSLSSGPAGTEARERLRVLFEALVPFSAELDLSEVLARVVRAACGLVGARYGALGVLDPDGRRLSSFYTYGISEEERSRIASMPTGRGVLGLLLREPGPRRVHDVREHPDAVGFPEGHPVMRTFLGAPIRVRGTIFGHIYLTEKAGGADFTDDDEAVVVALAAAAGVAIDNARLYERSQARQRWASAASELAQSLLASRGEDAPLALLARRARERSGARVTAVVLLDAADRLEVRALSRCPDPDPDAVPDPRRPADPRGVLLTGAAWSDLLEACQPVLHVPEQRPADERGGDAAGAEERAEDRARGAGRDDGSEALPDRDPRSRPATEVRRLLGLRPDAPVAFVPLAAGSHQLGLLVSAWAPDDEPAARDALPDQAGFALQAGVALSAARAQDDRARLALLEDRDRIARDMHDNVVQRLFATGLSLQAAVPLAQHPVVRSRLDEAVTELDSAIREIRQAIFGLHDADPGGGVLATIEALADSYAPSLGFTPRVSVEGRVGRLSEQLRADVVAVVREGLANVARHASAVSARVVVSTADGLTVTVTDDGLGTDPGAARSGLVNLAERARGHGGTLELGPGHPSGTVLRWWVPAPAGDEEARR